MCAIRTFGEKPSIFIRDKPTLSLERMLHKDYDRKGLVAKKNLVVSLKRLGAKTEWLAVNRQS
jgi:glucan phosphoethanolaminetransferase (alkaline phosphatase superfamily)